MTRLSHRPETDLAAPGLQAWLLFAALGYLVFVIYGSLVPLHFRAVPWDVALQRFRDMPFLALGPGSRADWVANGLLFVPLCFLWAAVVWPHSTARRVLASSLLLVAAVALSMAIEFVQVFFPQRTVSLNDIVAESIGAVVGIAAWWWLGAGVQRWLASLALVRGAASVSQRLLVVYLAVLFGYNLLPLDLTISPVEVFHKWQEGKIVVLPFTTAYEDGAQRLYDLVTDIAIWVPAAALWQLAYGKTRGQTWALAMAAAMLLEGLQLFVYSRVTDSTDVVMAGVGAAIGLALVRKPRASGASRPAASRAHRDRAGLWLAAALGWTVVLLLVFWYPFDFSLERSFVRERVAALDRVPFEAYYFGTEFRAITEVLRKSLFLAPLGFLLFRLGRGLPQGWPRGGVHSAMLLLLGAVVVVIEAGQVLLPGKVVDLADLALALLGGLIGYAGSHFVYKRLALAPEDPYIAPVNTLVSAKRQQGAASPRGLSSPALSALLLPSGIGLAVALIALWLLPQLPGVPYNVRELLAPPDAPWAGPIVAFVAVLLFGMPSVMAAAAAAALRPPGLPVVRTLTLLIGVPGAAAAVLFMGAPAESVRDLVGNAAYRGWPWGETWARLSILLLGVVWGAALGCALQGLPLAKGHRGSAIAHLLLHGLWVVPVWHLIVVDRATTDNLTELMSGGGTWWSSLCLLAYVVLWAAAASGLLAGLLMRSGRALIRSLLWLAVSVMVGYGLVSVATESALFKYGQVFSALQFLLSTDRSAYAGGHDLLLRFTAAHVLACLGAACAMAAVLALAHRSAAVRRVVAS